MTKIPKIYKTLLDLYEPQGWWPLSDIGRHNCYHPKDYTYPKTDNQQFEICIGAILTQNTAWKNVEKAITNLNNSNLLSPQSIHDADIDLLKQCIRPAGYFIQKTRKLRIFTDFYIGLKGNTPSRQQLLNLWGIGPETADSILLYAYRIPEFVVDAYTKRILNNLNLVSRNASYDDIKQLIESSLGPDFRIYQEFHALLVEHAKRYYRKKEDYKTCPLFIRNLKSDQPFCA